MTDREKLLALLAEFGVTPDEDKHEPDEPSVMLRAHEGGVDGYKGFVCAFDFDANGKFETVGVWE